MERVRVGIIGSGFMGRTHAEVIGRHVQRAELAAVAGGSRAAALAADYQVRAEASVESLVRRDDIDAVIITTPHAVHAAQGMLAAQNGKHLLVEKPLATTLEDCDRLIALCKASKLSLMTAQTQRFRQGNIVAKKLIDEGAIGRVLMLEEQQIAVHEANEPLESAETAGYFLGHGIHNADRFRWFTGEEAKWAAGFSTNYRVTSQHPHSSMACIHGASGAMATIWITRECPPPGFPTGAFFARVMGEKGLIEVDTYGLTRLGDEKGWRTVYEQPKFDFRKDPFSPIRLESFIRQDQEFIDSILERRSPAITGKDGRAAVEIVLGVYQAQASGKIIQFPLQGG